MSLRTASSAPPPRRRSLDDVLAVGIARLSLKPADVATGQKNPRANDATYLRPSARQRPDPGPSGEGNPEGGVLTVRNLPELQLDELELQQLLEEQQQSGDDALGGDAVGEDVLQRMLQAQQQRGNDALSEDAEEEDVLKQLLEKLQQGQPDDGLLSEDAQAPDEEGLWGEEDDDTVLLQLLEEQDQRGGDPLIECAEEALALSEETLALRKFLSQNPRDPIFPRDEKYPMIHTWMLNQMEQADKQFPKDLPKRLDLLQPRLQTRKAMQFTYQLDDNTLSAYLSVWRANHGVRIRPEQKVVLINWLMQNGNDPYPTQGTKQQLAEETNLTVSNVGTFLRNNRSHRFLLTGRAKEVMETWYETFKTAPEKDSEEEKLLLAVLVNAANLEGLEDASARWKYLKAYYRQQYELWYKNINS